MATGAVPFPSTVPDFIFTAQRVQSEFPTLVFFFFTFVTLVDRYEGCRKSTCFDNSPRYVKFDQTLAPLLEVRIGAS